MTTQAEPGCGLGVEPTPEDPRLNVIWPLVTRMGIEFNAMPGALRAVVPCRPTDRLSGTCAGKWHTWPGSDLARTADRHFAIRLSDCQEG
jgi:hypothetical protein